jgi:DnaJ-domain-containing protein 1
MKNYYQILEVSPDASQDIIKEQYRFLVQAWHPDKFPNSTQKIKAEEKIKEINVAYATLNNPIKRAEYDISIRFSRTNQEQEYHTQKEAQAAQSRATDERRKREEARRHAKEEQLRKERADKKRAEAERRSPPTITTMEVIKAWKQISSTVIGESTHLAALLNSVKMVDVQGSTLVLGFGSDVVKSMMKPEEIERTRKTVSDVLGVTLDVHCVVVSSAR